MTPRLKSLYEKNIIPKLMQKFNLKKLRIISPLKSFKILSKEKIKNVEIIFLISKFRLKFKNFLKTLT